MNQEDYDRLRDKCKDCKDSCLCEVVRCLVNDLQDLLVQEVRQVLQALPV